MNVYIKKIIESPAANNDFFTLFLGILTLLIILYQVYLTVQQIHLMKKQDEIINRKAKMIVRVSYEENQFIFDTQNIGNRGVKNFDWHIWVPKSFGDHIRINPLYTEPFISDFTQEIEGEQYLHFKGNFLNHIYPTRAKTFAKLKVDNIKGKVKFFFEIACEDGVFPDKIEKNPLNLMVE